MVFKPLIKHSIRQCHNGQGFTIIEVLIAMTVLSIGLLAIGTMQISSIKGNRSAMDISEASFLAERQLERLNSIPFGTLLDTNVPLDDGLNNTTGTPAADGTSTVGKYTLFWNFANNFPLNNTRTINVIITWSNKGTSKSLSMSCVRAS